MDMINVFLTYAALAANLVIFVRLFTYQRAGARYRPVVSLVSAICMGLAGATVIQILQGRLVFTLQMWPSFLILAIVAHGIMKTHGNLAKVIDVMSPLDEIKARSRL